MIVTDTATMKLPTVVLDTTLADLYRQAGSSYTDKRIGQVLSGFSAAVPLGPKIPPNRKYIYQDGPFTSSDGISHTDGPTTAIKYLSLVNQRDAFICGAAPAIFFHMDSSSQRRRHDQKQVVKTLATLSDAQRPHLVFCDGPECIPIDETGIDCIACKVINDDLEKYNNGVPLETHWFLNSKRALADSGLPTPKCVAVTVDGFPADAQSCCALCIGSGLQGFNQATFGGAGTFIVRTEDERQNIIDDLGKGFLSRLLSAVNAANSHLEPATMLLSDLVQDPVGDYGVTFFVNEKGRQPLFLGVSKQMIVDDTAWVGSIIDYKQQNELRLKFGSLINRISDWLQSYGYLGPAGADILEDADGTFHVVDLNVRTTGSCALPLLRTHFTSRGLSCASAFSIDVEKRRDDFLEMFPREFQAGRMCIVSWYEDEESGSSLAELVVGGEDENRLKSLMDRVNEVSKNVTFCRGAMNIGGSDRLDAWDNRRNTKREINRSIINDRSGASSSPPHES
ncbi:solid-state culture specific ATP-grasp domain-containing [Fusarium albosuccineum]|uniref:Solid-state culture specific ATP-grasp domain-containing n=1 Tax=Fusarium albosuccineum TaxID=1237068 RepID=A0A8H4LJA0_9HYPO|nr:solid-state culture specific ATP-grasp domain-containing [Fusarium albosuccineum]